MNTRVVKLAPLNKDKVTVSGDTGRSAEGVADVGVRGGETGGAKP